MPATTLALALSFVVLADPATPPAASPTPSFPLNTSGTSRDFDKPPPGAAADQALWKKAYDLNNDLVVAQYVSTRLQTRANGGALFERLKDPAKRGDRSANDAESLATRLSAAWAANFEVMTSQWPVSKVRVCRYELQNLEGVMLGDAARVKKAQLDDARKAVQACVAKASIVHDAARKTNEELEAAIVAAERALEPAESAAAARPAPAPGKP